MDGWEYGWVHVWVDVQMDGQVGVWMDRCIDGRVYVWVCVYMCMYGLWNGWVYRLGRWVYDCKYQWIGVGMCVCIGVSINGQVQVCMYVQV